MRVSRQDGTVALRRPSSRPSRLGLIISVRLPRPTPGLALWSCKQPHWCSADALPYTSRSHLALALGTSLGTLRTIGRPPGWVSRSSFISMADTT
eukprot:6762436-Alexandrium_andersonii.AAC.1